GSQAADDNARRSATGVSRRTGDIPRTSDNPWDFPHDGVGAHTASRHSLGKTCPLAPSSDSPQSSRSFPDPAFWHKTGFMPKVFCGLDVVFDDKGAVTHFPGQSPSKERIRCFGPLGAW